MSKVSAFPIEEVRAQFPALQRLYKGKPAAYFDGPGGSQVVGSSIDAIADYMRRGGANLHGQFPSSHETEAIIAEARQAIAVLLGAQPEEIAFGANMTALTLSISRALARNWNPGDELVVTELDHRANVDPWLLVAQDRGMTVRWLPVDPATLTLDLSKLEEIINPRTRLVAIGMASNAVGTINDVAAIAACAHAVGALVAVDGVHAVPHILIDRDQLGADIFLCSTYKFFGPHIGVAAIRKEVFVPLKPYKLQPAPTTMPDKLETGTQNHEGIAGIKPAVEFIASLGTGATLRERLVSGYERIEAHENRLAGRMRDGLAQMPRVRLFQAPAATAKTPTIAFQVEGLSPLEVCQRAVEEYSIFIAEGDFYASTLSERIGVHTSGAFIRAGLAPYNTDAEVDRFLQAMTEMTR